MTSITSPFPHTMGTAHDNVSGLDVPFRATLPKGEAERALVLKTGMGIKPEYVDGLADRLADRGIASFVLESRPQLLAKTDYHAREINAVLEHAKSQLPGAQFTVGGECFGGAAALRWNSLFNHDATPVVVMPPSIFTRPTVTTPVEIAKIFGSLVSDKLANETLSAAATRGVPVTSNPASPMFPDPVTGRPKVAVAEHPIGNYRDAALLPMKGLIGRWTAHGDVKPGEVKFLLAENDKDIYNGISAGYTKLYPNSTLDVIPGAEHSLTQEWNRCVVEAIDGFMHLRR